MAAQTSIIYWNANGLRHKTDELIDLMQECNAKIALINETKLSPHVKLQIPGYEIYRKDRPNSQGGGVAIIIDKNINHHEFNTPVLERLELICIKININNAPVVLGAAYNPPKNININDIKKIIKIDCPLIMAGDFNARHRAWNSRINNTNGKQLYNHCLRSTFVIQGPTIPTYTHASQKFLPDILDISIVKNIPYLIDYQVHEKLDSDHLPVEMILYSNIEKVVCAKHNYNKADWPKFQEQIDNKIDSTTEIKDTLSLDIAVFNLTNNIQAAIKASVPLHKPKPEKPIINNDIKKLIQLRNKLRKTNRRVSHPHVNARINALRILIRNKITKLRNDKWNKKVSELNTKDHSAWKLTKSLTQTKTIIPPLKSGNKIITDPKEKSELLATTLKDSFTPNVQDPLLLQHYNNVADSVKALYKTEENSKFKKYRSSQIKNILLKLKKKKAPGPDDIPNEALVHLPDSAIQLLTKIINSILKLGYFPNDWKIAKVLMLPKPGKDSRDPNNYRPISLLCTLSKVTEKAILTRLNKYLNSNKIIINEQFGFRSNHSTAQQVVRVVDHVTKGFARNEVTAMLLIDLQKAFDKVWHDGLIYKLHIIKIPQYLLFTIKSYLENRHFYVDSQGSRSSTKSIAAGVPQGSLLGPVLFNIYINDIPKDPKTTLAIYADDTAVMATSTHVPTAVKNLQIHTTAISTWFNTWRLKVNTLKCETILFQNSYKKYTNYKQIELNHEKVPKTKIAKYLGVHLDSRLKWLHHMKTTRLKASARLAQLYPILNKRSNIQTKTAINIYKATILPVLTYAAPAWTTVHKIHLKNLQMIQNKCLKIITNPPRYSKINTIHSELDILKTNKVIYNQCRNFFHKSSQHSNPLISKFTIGDQTKYELKIRPIHGFQRLETLKFYKD